MRKRIVSMHCPGTRRPGLCRPRAAALRPAAAAPLLFLGWLLFLCAFATPAPISAQQPAVEPAQPPSNLPQAPSVQVPSNQTPSLPTEPAKGAVSGFIVDRDGAAIAGARITLTLTSSSSSNSAAISTITSGPDGEFVFPAVPPGPFRLNVIAAGFSPKQSSGELLPAQSLDLANIELTVASSTDIQITATQSDIAEAQINQEEKQRVLDFIPNFSVSYIPDPVPLDPKQKFELAYKTLIDPVSLLLNGVVAGVQQANDTYSWGEGAQGYAKRYAAAYGTFLTGTMIGSAALPILFKQDPRYFYKGTGTVRARFGYALANAVICKGDNHRWQVNYSSILGGIAAGAISNAYYPAVNRSGAGLTFEGAAIGTGFSAVSNLFQEFLIRKLTPHIPANPPKSP